MSASPKSQSAHILTSLQRGCIAPFGFHAARRKTLGRLRRAFTLVETVIALGITSFAILAVVGMLPVGLITFRKAMDTSISSQIVEQVTTDLQQGGFSALQNLQSNPTMRYYDDQGNYLGNAGTAPSGTLYYVNPVVQSSSSLPSSPTGEQSTNLATITIEIVRNPGHQALQRNSTNSIENANGISVSRYPVFIASQS